MLNNSFLLISISIATQYVICHQKAQSPFFYQMSATSLISFRSSSRHRDPAKPQVVADKIYTAQRVWELGAFEGEHCVHLSELQTASLYEAHSKG